MSVELFAIFFLTTMVLVLSPGPAVLVVVSITVSNTLKQASWVILGIMVANITYFILSAMGVVTLILASPVLFSVIKWAGVAYLIYLGIKIFFNTQVNIELERRREVSKGFVSFFTRGYFLQISNPKALLYFSALLPQFVDISQPLVPQLLLLGVTVAILDMSCYGLYAYLGSATSAVRISLRTEAILKKMGGVFLVIAGIKMATFSQ